mmetsp:Transcript_16790/g.29078  ORF Transcript_16790/g.29078 Transcript_16790/m.29078 type:complete len:117 (+) Transcript_16790:1-351(+)
MPENVFCSAINACNDAACCVQVPKFCYQYKCQGRRMTPDPTKTNMPCSPYGCDDSQCCKKKRLRRRGGSDHSSYNPYFSGASQAGDEVEDSAFVQDALWCQDDDEDEECQDVEDEL